jgi:DNA-directed RNA polymerase specialized sigma24 family protein
MVARYAVCNDLARESAYAAVRRLHYPPVTREDIEDMAQEAAIVIWQCRGRSEAYAFTAARLAAINWFVRYHLGWKRHDRRAPPRTPQSSTWQMPEGYELPALQPEEERAGLPDEVTERLVSIFCASYKDRTVRALRSARRDARVVALSIAGHSPAGVALELGVATRTAQNYLERVRRVLWRYAREHGYLDDRTGQDRRDFKAYSWAWR